ncbi:hypothetical protein N657DRAFT_626454 [Parathielavia appendiculata]|uniref:Uncharacterized protein n=1 Tax=Parathielavia appendiculata TaxID=2587402 RepID=A0AAN6TSG5_9PEZI|nr:hypothetical protein N657DRAFT_626454 [Parathielavia appendiculata]
MTPTVYQYPGVNLPLDHLRQGGRVGIDFYRLGSFEGAEGVSELIQVREVFMMVLMDRLTDKPNWHEKVFDDAIVAKWRTEALAQPEGHIYRQIIGPQSIPIPRRTKFMTPEVFDYCISELRSKAAHFKETELIFTLNSPQGYFTEQWSHNTAIKSDSVVSPELQRGLKAAFEKLRRDQAAEPDWHPGSDDKVQDLVHPSMYPFVYGQTRFIQEEVVGVDDAVEKWSGKGDVVPKPEKPRPVEGREWEWEHGHAIERDYWSQTYQWLPANLAFQEDGTVRFTSYINNLHPKKHPEIYRLVERLIDAAIPAWDRVLSSNAWHKSGSVQRRFDLPPKVNENNRDAVWEKFNSEILGEHEAREGPVSYDPEDVEYLSDDEVEREMSDLEAKKARKVQRLKWRLIRDPLLPEPLAFDSPVEYKVRQKLRKRFKHTGLQVIVKMASIELTPEKPDFPLGSWHIEGQMNEHIVATALYYVDSENVQPSHLSFRMATSEEQEALQDRVGQDLYRVYERIYGTELSLSGRGGTVQSYGSVATPEGRLLAFPNILQVQHRVSHFGLQDRTKPGHRRFIALWLVNPFQRIISTANVPPQQFDWWAEAVFGTGSRAAKGEMPPELFQLLLEEGASKTVKPTEALLRTLENRLPPEVMEMVRRHRAVPDGLMTVEEARRHRLALMEERTAFVGKVEEEWTRTYSFCEH